MANDLKTKLLKPIVIVPLLVGLVFGVFFGAIVQDKPSATAVRTIATPGPIQTKTVTEQVEVATVPQECLDALDSADDGFTQASRLAGVLNDLVTAVQTTDASRITGINDTLADITSELDTIVPSYTTNKELCRAAGSSS